MQKHEVSNKAETPKSLESTGIGFPSADEADQNSSREWVNLEMRKYSMTSQLV